MLGTEGQTSELTSVWGLRLKPPRQSASSLRDAISRDPAAFFRQAGLDVFVIGVELPIAAGAAETVDVLGVAPDGRAVVVLVVDPQDSCFDRALSCSGMIAGWRPEDFLALVREERDLRRFLCVPAMKLNLDQHVVLVAPRFRREVIQATKWLRKQHGFDVQCVRATVDADATSGEQRVVVQSRSGRARNFPTVQSLAARTATPAPIHKSWLYPVTDLAPGANLLDRWSLAPLAPPSSSPSFLAQGEPADRMVLLWRPEVEPARQRRTPKTVAKPATSEKLAAGAHVEVRRWFSLQRLAGLLWIAAAVLMSVGIWFQIVLPRQQAAREQQEQPPPAPVVSHFTGTVSDAATGLPVAGAQLLHGSLAALTDETGRFELERQAGAGTVLVKAPGYRQLELFADEPRELGALQLQPLEVRALYVNHDKVGDAHHRRYIRGLLELTGSNAVVLGVKDSSGRLNVAIDDPLAKRIGALDHLPLAPLADEVAYWKSEGIYTIGLVVLFKDGLMARKEPGLALTSLRSKHVIRDAYGIGWVDPASSQVREYNLEVTEAAAQAGFEDIQFDFVRYPAEPLSNEGADDAEKQRRLQVVTDFLHEAAQRLRPYNVYLGASVFGGVCNIQHVGVIGQRLEDFASAMDYVSPMLYPSHFRPGSRFPSPLHRSYDVVYHSLVQAAGRLGGATRRLRPWLQNFPDQQQPEIPLKAEMIFGQVKAARDAQSSGWMLWDARNRYLNTAEALRRLPAVEQSPRSPEEAWLPGRETPPGSPLVWWMERSFRALTPLEWFRKG
jgi:hypothetical protein